MTTMPAVTVTGPGGLPLMCETCGAPATGSWRGITDGKMKLTCDEHNPLSSTVAFPSGFTVHSVPPFTGGCTCGQCPVHGGVQSFTVTC